MLSNNENDKKTIPLMEASGGRKDLAMVISQYKTKGGNYCKSYKYKESPHQPIKAMSINILSIDSCRDAFLDEMPSLGKGSHNCLGDSSGSRMNRGVSDSRRDHSPFDSGRFARQKISSQARHRFGIF